MKTQNEKKLYKLMQHDNVGSPKQEVEDRLVYTFMLKSGNSIVRQNSFAGFINWIFSSNGLGVKTAAFTLLITLTLMNSNLKQEGYTTISADTTFVEKALVLDSTVFSPEISPNKNDTLF